MSKFTMTPEEEERFKANVKQYSVATGQDPAKHGKLPFHLFDPGKKDPWRELHLVDAENRGVTTLGPLQDPTDMTLGNALFIMECVNLHEDLLKRIADLGDSNARVELENKNLLSEIHNLRYELGKKNAEITTLKEQLAEVRGEVP